MVEHNKGDKTDLKHDRPITIRNLIYKLHGYEPKEQGGLRKGSSANYTLLTMKKTLPHKFRQEH